MTKRRNYVHRNAPKFFHQWKEWEEGQFVEGIVVGSEKDAKYKRMNYIVKVEDFDIDCKNKEGVALKEGDHLLLNGCGCLERNMEGVGKGDAIKVVYTGSAKVTKGDWEGESCHTMDVFVDEVVESSDDEDEDVL